MTVSWISLARRHRRPSLVMALALGPLSALAAAAAVTATYDAAPLRVVRVARAQPQGLRQWVVASLGGCAAKLNMPAPSFPPGLTDAVMSQFEVRRQEELFSGAYWALYDTERTIGADVREGCRLTVFTRRHAEADQACRDRAGWSNAPLGLMMDLDHPVEGGPESIGPPKHQGCGMGARRGLDIEGLPRDKAGQVACVWRSDIIGQRLAALTTKLGGGPRDKPSHQPGSFDTCLYASTPEYRTAGGSRPVVVKHQSPPLVGQSGVTFHVTEENALELDSLTEGTPIPLDRFSSAALKAFVAQPTRTPWGD